MLKAYKYRIYPTEEQETFLCKELGLKRLYWNLALAAKQENHKYQLKGYKQVFEEFRPEAIDWCKEVDSTALASVWSELRQAYQNFFESCNGTRKGKFVKGVAKQSNNYEKSKYQVAKLHEKVANQRLDWLHKLSRDLANKYENVVVENINLQDMAGNLNHGKVVSDQGFGMLRTMISYKTNLIKVNQKNTSRRCHCCGEINEKVVLGVRKWECPTCGAIHDRDINAAINIMMLAVSRKGTIRKSNASGEPSSSVKEESPSTSLSGVRLGS